MKRLGLVGGLSAMHFEVYWQTIRNEAQKSRGAAEMPELFVHSVGTGNLKALLATGDWAGMTNELIRAGQASVDAGADGLVICASALNPAATDVACALRIPVIDLGGSIMTKMRILRFRRVAVLGIRSTVEAEMWCENLKGLDVLLPSKRDEEWLNTCIDAFVAGQSIPPEWKIRTYRIISLLRRLGAQALVLAQPPLGHWIKPGESVLYPLDAAEVHAWIAAQWALQSSLLPVMC